MRWPGIEPGATIFCVSNISNFTLHFVEVQNENVDILLIHRQMEDENHRHGRSIG